MILSACRSYRRSHVDRDRQWRSYADIFDPDRRPKDGVFCEAVSGMHTCYTALAMWPFRRRTPKPQKIVKKVIVSLIIGGAIGSIIGKKMMEKNEEDEEEGGTED